jgi:hypothetical protein
MAWKELSVSDWNDEINQGLKFRQLYGLEDRWSKLEALYLHVHKSHLTAGPNIIASTGDALLSTLAVPFPYLSVKPRRMDFVPGARVVESVDNMLVRKLRFQEAVERACLSAYLWGVGFLKIGYDSEFGWDERHDIGGTGQPTGMSMSQFDVKGRRIEFADSEPGMPWVDDCLPHDIVVPWGTRTVRTAPYVVHRVVRHIDDVKADPKYENKKFLKPCMSMEDFVKSYNTTVKPYRAGGDVIRQARTGTDSEYCELWEIHDRRTGRVMVLATGHDSFLRNEVDGMQVKGLPFVELKFVPNSRNLWTTPDAYYLRAAQAELTDITKQSQAQRRISLMKFLYHRRAIDEEELEKAMSPDTGPGVAVNDDIPLAEAIQVLQPGGNFMLYQEAEQTRRNARETVGFSRNQFGEYEATGRRTATEATVVDRASGLRMTRRQMVVANAYTESFEKINRIIAEQWKGPRIAEIVGPDGAPTWVQYTGALFEGDYEYSIGFSSEAGETLGGRKQLAAQLYATLSQDPTVDPLQLRRYLSDAFADPSFSSIFKPGVLTPGGVQGANVQLPMSGMQGGEGGVQAPPGAGAGGEMPPMP